MRLVSISVALAGLCCAACQTVGPGPPSDSPLPSAAVVESAEQVVGQSPLSSEPLVLHCRCANTDQQHLLKELAAERSTIGTRLALPPSNQPLHIHLFADHANYRQHVAARYPDFPARRAIFVDSAEQLSVYAHQGEHMAEDLRHEATHGYLHAVVPNLPLWLDEGLAEYFEVGRGKHGHNQSHIDLLTTRRAEAAWLPNLPALEMLTDGGAMTQLQYAEAWLWVHFLLESPDDKSDVLLRYLQDLRSGVAVEPLSARLARRAANPVPAALAHLESLGTFN